MISNKYSRQKTINLQILYDGQAEDLERKGFWRRAAQRWQTVMNAAIDENIRQAASLRKHYCLNKTSLKKNRRCQGARFVVYINDEFLLS